MYVEFLKRCVLFVYFANNNFTVGLEIWVEAQQEWSDDKFDSVAGRPRYLRAPQIPQIVFLRQSRNTRWGMGMSVFPLEGRVDCTEGPPRVKSLSMTVDSHPFQILLEKIWFLGAFTSKYCR